MTEYVKGNKKDISIQERYYAHEEKIKRLTDLVSILWTELRGGAPRITRGLKGVRVEECVDGEFTYEKPEHLDCGTLSEDMGCQTLDTKPDTVPDPDDIPPE